jgi:hypothetical protein
VCSLIPLLNLLTWIFQGSGYYLVGCNATVRAKGTEDFVTSVGFEGNMALHKLERTSELLHFARALSSNQLLYSPQPSLPVVDDLKFYASPGLPRLDDQNIGHIC